MSRPFAQRRLAGATRLHLGCGDNVIPGWTNVDLRSTRRVVGLNLTKVLPVESGSIDYIYSEHFIEHIPLPAAQQLLQECRRVLRPGGVLRLSTPDLAKLASEYLLGRTREWADVQWNPATPCQMVNEGMREWGHQFVYDRHELTEQLLAAGFSSVERAGWRVSVHPELSGLECRPFHDEVIVEATR